MNNLKNIEDIYNITPFQETVIHNYQQAPGAGLYLMNLKIRFEGSLDEQVFTESWKNIIRKYPAFRTGFHKGKSGDIFQMVHKNIGFEPEFIDWSDMETNTRHEHFQKLLKKDIQNDYNLKNPPFTRITVIKEPAGTFLMWWRFPQLLMDGWNIPVVLLDFFDFYRKIASSTELSVTPGHSLKEYVQTLKIRDRSEEKTFWKNYLNGYVPADRKDGVRPANENRHIRTDKNISHLYAPIIRLTQKYKLNINTVFQASYMLALMKLGFTPRHDSVCGTTVTDRPMSLEDHHTRVGLYLNILPLRICSMQPGMSFVNWLETFQKEILKALRFSASSENEIKNYCEYPQEKSLFDNIIIFENMPYNQIDFDGLPFRMTGYDFENRPNAKLNLFVWPEENMLLKLIYDRNYHNDKQARNILDEIETILTEWIANEEITLDTIGTKSITPILNEALV